MVSEKLSARKETDKTSDQEWERLSGEWQVAHANYRGFKAGADFYKAVEAIAVLYEQHEHQWSDWLRSHGVKVQSKKPFRALIRLLTHGKSGAAWATKISATLDEWEEHLRRTDQDRDALPADALAAYFEKHGGIQGIYEARRDRLGKAMKPRRRRTANSRIAELERQQAELRRQCDEYHARMNEAEAKLEQTKADLEWWRQRAEKAEALLANVQMVAPEPARQEPDQTSGKVRARPGAVAGETAPPSRPDRGREEVVLNLVKKPLENPAKSPPPRATDQPVATKLAKRRIDCALACGCQYPKRCGVDGRCVGPELSKKTRPSHDAHRRRIDRPVGI